MFALYPRLRAMGVEGYETTPNDVRLMPERLRLPMRWKKLRYVFVNSMSDMFHPDIPPEFVLKTFSVMRESSSEYGHIFQILTKRPGLAVKWWQEHQDDFPDGWPDNIWIGTSVESQKYAIRVKVLARLPAAIRFVSAEPLLDRLDLTPWLTDGTLQWLIVGGESGPGARPMSLDWARDLRDQAADAGVAFFLKQLGGKNGKRSGANAILDGRTWQEYPG